MISDSLNQACIPGIYLFWPKLIGFCIYNQTYSLFNFSESPFWPFVPSLVWIKQCPEFPGKKGGNGLSVFLKMEVWTA